MEKLRQKAAQVLPARERFRRFHFSKSSGLCCECILPRCFVTASIDDPSGVFQDKAKPLPLRSIFIQLQRELINSPRAFCINRPGSLKKPRANTCTTPVTSPTRSDVSELSAFSFSVIILDFFRWFHLLPIEKTPQSPHFGATSITRSRKPKESIEAEENG